MTGTQTLTLSAFLLARIAEDEAEAGGVPVEEFRVTSRHSDISNAITRHALRWQPTRVLAECAAHRRIVERHRSRPSWHPRNAVDICAACGDSYPCPDLRDLASVYSDHPDWRAEWAL